MLSSVAGTTDNSLRADGPIMTTFVCNEKGPSGWVPHREKIVDRLIGQLPRNLRFLFRVTITTQAGSMTTVDRLP